MEATAGIHQQLVAVHETLQRKRASYTLSVGRLGKQSCKTCFDFCMSREILTLLGVHSSLASVDSDVDGRIQNANHSIGFHV